MKEANNKYLKDVNTFPVPYRVFENNDNIFISNNKYSNEIKDKIINKAINFHLQGDILKASKYYQIFIDRGFKDPRVLSNYGVIFQESGHIDKAIKLYKESIDLFPNHPEPYSNFGYILRDLGELKEALSLTLKAIELNPNFAMAYLNLGSIMNDLGKKDEAEKYIREAVRLAPGMAQAYCNLGGILREVGKANEAEKYIRQVIQIDPNYAEAYNKLATILLDNGESDEARKAILNAIKINPNIANYYSNLGGIMKEMGKIKQAIKYIRKAIEINPNFAFAYFQLSLINTSLDRDNLEKYLFSKSILKSKENISNENKADIYFARGNILDRRSDFTQSTKMFVEANRLTRISFGSNYDLYKNKLELDTKALKELSMVSDTYNNFKGLPCPIFLVGLPRAGKTTIESILACNSRLAKLGDSKGLSESINEYLTIEKACNLLELSRNSTYKERKKAYLNKVRLNHPDLGGNEEIMLTFTNAWEILKKENEKRDNNFLSPTLSELYFSKFQDKISSCLFTCSTSPNNCLYLATIISKMPESKIIYCYRNTNDHLIELFRYNLKDYYTLKTSLSELEDILLLIEENMKLYKKKFPSKIYFQSFDDLIFNPEKEIKSLVSWLNWTFEPSFLTPKLFQKGMIKSENDLKSLNTSYIGMGNNYSQLINSINHI